MRPLFATIIGINTYAESSLNLVGACADADDVSDFVLGDLATPPDRVVNLRNENATRYTIKNALKNLIDNDEIEKNDPILIFFAGHGTETAPPEEWTSYDETVQMILPHDFSSTPVQSDVGQGLLDLTFAILLTRIADAKGNNIVSPPIPYHC